MKSIIISAEFATDTEMATKEQNNSCSDPSPYDYLFQNAPERPQEPRTDIFGAKTNFHPGMPKSSINIPRGWY